jgi:hypothetical protein
VAGSNRTAKGTFAIASWDEKPYLQLANGGKLTKASVTAKFSGDVTGEGKVEWLMCYVSDDDATFVGLQHIDGSLAGKKGTFVVETIGDFDGKAAKGTWSVVPGTGTGDLAGLEGEGRFEAPKGPKATYELDYDIAEALARR